MGFDYVHSLVADHSRLAHSEILPDEKGPTCAGFLRRGVAYFHAHGITKIERVMTDNVWAYRWSIRDVCAELDARQDRHYGPYCGHGPSPNRTSLPTSAVNQGNLWLPRGISPRLVCQGAAN
jgi:hypothetical protein